MIPRKLILALVSAHVVLIGIGAAYAVECTVCDRRMVDCRAPAQSKFVGCMNGEKPGCNVKCSDNCRAQKDAQKCTLDCVKSCQGAGSCRAVYASATSACSREFQTCRKDCTGPR